MTIYRLKTLQRLPENWKNIHICAAFQIILEQLRMISRARMLEIQTIKTTFIKLPWQSLYFTVKDQDHWTSTFFRWYLFDFVWVTFKVFNKLQIIILGLCLSSFKAVGKSISKLLIGKISEQVKKAWQQNLPTTSLKQLIRSKVHCSKLVDWLFYCI